MQQCPYRIRIDFQSFGDLAIFQFRQITQAKRLGLQLRQFRERLEQFLRQFGAFSQPLRIGTKIGKTRPIGRHRFSAGRHLISLPQAIQRPSGRDPVQKRPPMRDRLGIFMPHCRDERLLYAIGRIVQVAHQAIRRLPDCRAIVPDNFFPIGQLRRPFRGRHGSNLILLVAVQPRCSANR